MVEEVGTIIARREVAVGRKFFGTVEHGVAGDATAALEGFFTVAPKTPKSLGPLKAHHVQPLFQAGFDGRKAATASSDNGNQGA